MLSPAAILPNSVRGPVATTTPTPLPALTTVPISAQPASSASGVPAGTASTDLSTGSDSPVRTDSSHSSPVTFEQPQIGRDDVAQAELHDIARDEVGDVHCRRLPIADGDRFVVDLVVQRLGGFLGPVFVGETEPDRQARR